MKRHISSLLMCAIPSVAFAQECDLPVHVGWHSSGEWAIWVIANICYAGLRAQSNPSRGWRIVSFIFGFPGTLLSYFVIKEGSERAYGIDLPRRR